VSPPGRAAPLAARLAAHLEADALLRRGDRILVACSGGLDSVTLLHLVRFGLPDWSLELRAAHLDHAMRPDSARDAGWVAGLCRAWGVPLVLERAAPPPESEAEARRVRYDFLERVARADERILTAHTADDQAETLVFRMIRGTGLRGLRGIRPVRGQVVRPLLPFRRDDVVEYARGARIAFREDPSNRDLRFARNRIRHRVLPELERARPGATRALARLAHHADRADRGWKSLMRHLERDVVLQSDEAGATLARPMLRSYHPHLRAGVLRHVLRRYGPPPDRAGTRAALEFISSGRSGGGVDLPGGVRLERDFDAIRISRRARELDATGPDSPLVIGSAGPGEGTARIGGRSLWVAWSDAEAGGRNGPGERAAFPGRLAYPLTLRGWRPGDRIRLGYGTKKLKKLFSERRLDRRSRDRVPVLVDAVGRVLWAVGVAQCAGEDRGGGALQITVADAEQR